MRNIFTIALVTAALFVQTDVQAQVYARAESATYEDNLSLWIIGQLRTSVSGGLVVSRTDYDPATALPIRTYAFDKLQQTMTYDTSSAVGTGQRGSLKAISDGRDGTFDTTTTFSNWKRGIPQRVDYPDNTVGYTSVNDNGWIESVIDENGSKTCYGFDSMGRLATVIYPSESQVGVCSSSTSSWTATSRGFVRVDAIEFGIPAGHWRQTINTGNGFRITYFDALWQPLVTRVYDAANVAATQRFTRQSYDSTGRITFASYPGTTDALTTGIRTTYDVLDRVIRVEQDSELGVLASTTAYLSGFKTRDTNPRGFQTTTSYMAYDQPGTDWPVTITHPEGAITDIGRDAFGKPLNLTRRNADNSSWQRRYFAYDAYQQLCKRTELETVTTFMTYDAAGNLAWSAAGLPWSPSTSCAADSAAAYASGRRVDRTYDARNRVSTLSFPDGNGNQSWSYTPDGLPAQVTTYNGTNNTLPVVNGYSYNKRRLLTGESSSQSGWYTWNIGYGYNTNGHLASHAYPDGLVVAYAPNAIGQPTQAGTYATGVSYFPNGAIKQFTYGNGIVHTLTQNARQLPDTSRDAYGATEVLDDGYDYDGNANVAAISDGLSGARGNRTMGYDGLDRLKTTVSPMYGTTGTAYTYDVLDNLKTVVTPGRSHTYVYDANWRLTNVANTVGGASVIGLGYDLQGNLANKNGVLYDFDFGNRLRTVTNQESYRYDALGRRVLAWATQSQRNILSHYAQNGKLLFQQNQRLNKNLGHIYLGGSLVAVREWDTVTNGITTKYQHTDALGSPVAVTNSARTVLERSEYEPYGKLLNRALTDGPGFTGHVMDAATGLIYMQQRYYDPTLGRFLSVDPVTANGNTGGNFNRYWYANNNPYKFTDPDGRQAADLRATAAQSELARRDVQEVRTAEMRPIGEAINAAAQTLGNMFVSQFTDGPGGGIGAGTAAMARGVVSEARVLKSMGEVKNTEKVVNAQGRSIPDFQNARQVGEIKDAKRVTDSSQLRAQREFANSTGREHTVVTGLNSKVSQIVEKLSTIVRRTDLGPP